MQDFELTITISPDGETVEGEVKGIKGHGCGDVQKLLDKIGDELEHRHTPEWDQRVPVAVGGRASRWQRIGG